MRGFLIFIFALTIAAPAFAAPCPVFDRTMADIEKTLDIRDEQTRG